MKVDVLNPRRGRPRLRRLLILTSAITLSWLIVSMAVGYALTRRPHSWHEEQAPVTEWGRIESQRLTTTDGYEIGSWFVDGRPESPSVLILHGHKGNRGNSLGRAKFFASMGYAVLMISLRSHGDSSGDYDDVGYGARNDVIAAVGFMEQRRPGRSVIIVGNSMGAAAAVFAAGELGHRVSGYVLECPYQDLKGAVWNRTENALPPFLSHLAYLGLRLAGLFFLPHLEKISPVNAIGKIPEDVPVLIISGEADRSARPDEARALYARVKAHGKLVMVPKAGHGHLWNEAQEIYEREVKAFCEQVGKGGQVFAGRCGRFDWLGRPGLIGYSRTRGAGALGVSRKCQRRLWTCENLKSSRSGVIWTTSQGVAKRSNSIKFCIRYAFTIRDPST